jgi:hypothetical protein
MQIPEGPALCMECWGIYQDKMHETQRLNFAFMNYLHDEMDFVVGVGPIGPRIKVPTPTYVKNAPITMNTTNNIHVEAGSQVGQINAGALVYLDHAVSAFHGAGNAQLAAALKNFTQSVVDSKDIAPEKQREVLDLLQVLVEQTAKSKDKRNESIAKLAFQNIGGIVSAFNLVAAHWQTLKQFFEHLFK